MKKKTIITIGLVTILLMVLSVLATLIYTAITAPAPDNDNKPTVKYTQKEANTDDEEEDSTGITCTTQSYSHDKYPWLSFDYNDCGWLITEEASTDITPETNTPEWFKLTAMEVETNESLVIDIQGHSTVYDWGGPPFCIHGEYERLYATSNPKYETGRHKPTAAEVDESHLLSSTKWHYTQYLSSFASLKNDESMEELKLVERYDESDDYCISYEPNLWLLRTTYPKVLGNYDGETLMHPFAYAEVYYTGDTWFQAPDSLFEEIFNKEDKSLYTPF